MANKIKITSYKDEKFGSKLGDMELDFIPNTINLGHTIEYHDESPPNTSAPEAKFKNTGPETLSFEIVFDGTGVVDGEKIDVTERIDEFKKLTYYYNGDTHETPYVNVSLGEDFIDFSGRLKSLDIKYTHFDRQDTKPTRAKLNVSFTNSTDSETEAKERDKQSPDLTHMRMVKAGDTLPLMCQQIYGDSSVYLKVARVNGLTDFRNLQPGSEISFPPIK